MAKNKSNMAEVVEADILSKGDKEIKKKEEVKISVSKYFQLYGEEIDKYSKAYLTEELRGIIDTKESWDREIKELMEA
jgi:hypothetical protein